eukprot:7743100-Pyramimonas_sp.AAC.2
MALLAGAPPQISSQFLDKYSVYASCITLGEFMRPPLDRRVGSSYWVWVFSDMAPPRSPWTLPRKATMDPT